MNRILNTVVFVPIVLKTFEKLDWDLVYQDELLAEAKRNGNWNRWTEKITVAYENGIVKVKSVSLGNEPWDNGRNSKRVQLFKYAFQQTESEFDKEALVELEHEVERANNWDNYKIPETLPQPEKRTLPQLWILIVGGAITAILLAFLVALLTIKFTCIIGIFEIAVAFIIGFALKYLIRASNYTNFNVIRYLIIGIVGIIFISNQYFLYQFFLNEINYESIGFIEFISLN